MRRSITLEHGGSFEGVVLCGGASRRMGRDKALIEVGGFALAARAAEALRLAGASSVLMVGGDADALRSLGLAVRADDHPGAGPLAATITALEATGSEVVMVMSCDLLGPSATAIDDTVRALLAHPAALGAVPVVDGHRQWTHAAWRRDVLPELRCAFVGGERSLHRAAGHLPLVDVLGVDPAALSDADEPGDLP